MKKLILAACLVAAGATTAAADYRGWNHNDHPYEERHHAFCQEKAERLHRLEFEFREAREHGREGDHLRHEIHELEHNLNETCGGYRWR